MVAVVNLSMPLAAKRATRQQHVFVDAQARVSVTFTNGYIYERFHEALKRNPRQ